MKRLAAFGDLLFVFATLLVVSSSLTMTVITSLGVRLPQWATSEGATYLAGGVKNSHIREHCTIDSVLEGSFQIALSDAVGNRIPFKASLLLSNAAMQRLGISLMAGLLSYDCYPTFFGSSKLYLPEDDALLQLPDDASQDVMAKFEQFGQEFSEYAREHKDVSFVLFIAAGSRMPAVNPAYDLMSNPLTAQLAVDAIVSQIDDLPNVVVVSDANDYSSTEEYFKEYFKTDHHWNIVGATRQFNKAMEVLGRDSSFGESDNLVDLGITFHGSKSRSGLQMVVEPALDSTHDYSSMNLIWNNGTEKLGSDHAQFYADEGLQSWHFYEQYYEAADIYDAQGDGVALLVTDSYGSAIAKMIAEQYDMLYRRYDFHYQHKGGTLSELIEEYQPDDVWLIACLDDYQSFLSRSPEYFSD